MMKALFAAIFLLVHAQWTWASGDFCQKALTTFTSNQIDYRTGNCCDNIYFFIKKLAEDHPDIEISKGEIIYLYSRWSGDFHYLHGYNYFVPLRYRSEELPRWGFHVVFKHQNLIYDFDYSEIPVPVEVKTYFKLMFDAYWTKENNSLTYHELRSQHFLDSEDEILPINSDLKLHLRIIPAKIYLNEYSPVKRSKPQSKPVPGEKNYKYWLKNSKEIPDQTLENYLLNLFDQK